MDYKKAGVDIDDEGESLNNVEKVLNKFDIKLRDSMHEFRNMEDVIDEVGQKWKNFNSVQQQQIATAIAGETAPEHIEIYGWFYTISFVLYR